MSRKLKVPASYYQQFNADYTREVPAESFGGWKKAEIELAPDHTALVVMHAWDTGTEEQWPGWRRCVEYYPRARKILEAIFPPLLNAVRKSPLPVFHVVDRGLHDFYSHLPNYKKTVELAGPSPDYPQVMKDPLWEKMESLRADCVFPGSHNKPDITEGSRTMDFAETARPAADEPLAENGHQLACLCHAREINHLIYIGFAVNWCLLMSPGGMVDMRRYGLLCSTIREAVTAVENAETAREEREKAQALWRTSLNFGFVFAMNEFIDGLRGHESPPSV